MDELTNCYFCNAASEHVFDLAKFGGSTTYFCPKCGRYQISKYYESIFDKEKTAQYLFYDRVMSSGDDKIVKFLGVEEQFTKLQEQKYSPIKYRLVTKDDIDNWYPRNFQEKINKVLLILDKLSLYYGFDINLDEKELEIVCFAHLLPHDEESGFNQVYFIMDYLKKEKLIEYVRLDEWDEGFCLLPKAYGLIYDLQKSQSANSKVFIACWFKKEENVKVIVEALKSAVKECGYEPNPICEKFHNNWIMPEILYEIKDSKFVIADLTGHRGGVYYEAGYADALGKQVILTCQENDEVHFDLEQRNMIKWKDYIELKSKLISHIKGMKGLGLL